MRVASVRKGRQMIRQSGKVNFNNENQTQIISAVKMSDAFLKLVESSPDNQSTTLKTALFNSSLRLPHLWTICASI